MIDPDIVAAEITLQDEPTLSMVEEFNATVSELVADRGPVGLLTTQAVPYFFSAEIVEYMEEHSGWFDRAAFVVTSAFERAAVRSFQFAVRDPRPMYIADSFDEALEWLRGPGREAAASRGAH